MKKIDMEIVDIALSGSSSGAYAMVLGEVGGSRKLPIVIGGSEAQAIAIEMEKMKASRPLTHDLFRNAFEVFGLTVTEVLIYNMVEGIFYAKLICSDGVREEEVDARPSDGVALAYRFNAPIRCYDSVLDAAGEDEEEAPRTQVAHVGSDDRSLEELEEELQNAIEREDYERASRLRDEIERRKGG
jgi:bifunctional DNase/RNase